MTRGKCWLKSGELTPTSKEGHTAFYHMTPPPPPREMNVADEEIDAVVTWADSTDPAWQARFEAAVGRPFRTSVRFTPGSAGPETEVCVALEKIGESLPWIRAIYVVTQRPQMPSCVNTIPNARVVFHDQIELPVVFNSCAIETSLHLIPGLSAKFLYLNDDFYVLRPLSHDQFFRHGWMPLVRFDQGVGWDSFGASNRRTLDAVGLTSMSASLAHWPYALTHEMMEDMRQQLGPVWNHTRDCKVRYECGDGEIAPILAAMALALSKGMAVDDPHERNLYPDRYFDNAPSWQPTEAMIVINALHEDEGALRWVVGLGGW